MRERVLARTPDAKRAVIEVSRDLDGRVTEPLEIAVGDRLRIGATQWDKQLFNGTVVTVEDIEVNKEEGAAVSRKARNRQAGGRENHGPEAGEDRLEAGRAREGFERNAEDEHSVFITARTDDGRAVSFRHDEIRDFHDNIRLDYGYAMTIASAQGITVDRAFLLIDDRPSRETVYPAATRHREGIDVYVNRAPIVFDIAEHRPEDEADMPVTDIDVRAYLAERWSRSQPKEAALDYIADGAWRDARERTQLAASHEAKSKRRSSGAAASETGQIGRPRSCGARRSRRTAGRGGGGNGGGERQRHRPHRPGNPPCGQRLAPRRGRRRLRGGERRGHGGVGRAAPSALAPRARRWRSARPSARPSTVTAR